MILLKIEQKSPESKWLCCHYYLNISQILFGFFIGAAQSCVFYNVTIFVCLELNENNYCHRYLNWLKKFVSLKFQIYQFSEELQHITLSLLSMKKIGDRKVSVQPCEIWSFRFCTFLHNTLYHLFLRFGIKFCMLKIITIVILDLIFYLSFI